MIASNEFVPAASWVLTPQGRALDLGRTRSWWRIVRDPVNVRMMDVMSVFFDEDQQPQFRDLADQRADAWETLDHAEFMDYCRAERMQKAGQHDYEA